ncbi:MAG: biopolymer transporter ExbD [Bacteroidota bacterium]
MAELTPSDSNKRKRTRTKRKNVHLDMTAMVDVAFLLLTFFVLTATLAKDKLIEMLVPPKKTTNVEVNEEKILTLVLEAENQLSYFHGQGPEVLTTDYSPNGLRTVLNDHLSRHPNRCSGNSITNCWDPIFVIKARNSSRFANLVDIIDEMKIVNAPKFVLADFTEADSMFIEQAKMPL